MAVRRREVSFELDHLKHRYLAGPIVDAVSNIRRIIDSNTGAEFFMLWLTDPIVVEFLERERVPHKKNGSYALISGDVAEELYRMVGNDDSNKKLCIGVVSWIDWEELFGAYNPRICDESIEIDGQNEAAFGVAFASVFGIPHTACKFETIQTNHLNTLCGTQRGCIPAQLEDRTNTAGTIQGGCEPTSV